MSTMSDDGTQSGGLNIHGGTLNTGGGAIVGRDNIAASPVASMYVESSGDRPQENIVKVLKDELKGKNDQIKELINDNKNMDHNIAAIDAVFKMVKFVIGEHMLTVNEYIVHTCLFLQQRKLDQEFKSYLPIEALKAGKKND
jgi:hypothetical protein